MMFVDDARECLLAQPYSTEVTPFGPDVLVYKVGRDESNKMFATLGIDDADEHGRMNLKCDPERALELREEHEAIIPGYHMNKRHWNTLVLDGSLPESLVRELISHSYALVRKSLPKKLRDELDG